VEQAAFQKIKLERIVISEFLLATLFATPGLI